MNARKRAYSVAGHRRKEVLVAGKIWSRERFGRGKDLVAGKIWSRERSLQHILVTSNQIRLVKNWFGVFLVCFRYSTFGYQRRAYQYTQVVGRSRRTGQGHVCFPRLTMMN
jgi:hypothetical protein